MCFFVFFFCLVTIRPAGWKMASGEKEGHSESTVGLPQVVQAIHTFPSTDRSSHRETRCLLNAGPPRTRPRSCGPYWRPSFLITVFQPMRRLGELCTEWVFRATATISFSTSDYSIGDARHISRCVHPAFNKHPLDLKRHLHVGENYVHKSQSFLVFSFSAISGKINAFSIFIHKLQTDIICVFFFFFLTGISPLPLLLLYLAAEHSCHSWTAYRTSVSASPVTTGQCAAAAQRPLCPTDTVSLR